MKLNSNKAKGIFFIAVIASLFIAALVQVSSQENVRYSDLEKQEIGSDAESQDSLKEYYGEVLGSVKTEAKFNTIATKDEIAVLNVTIDGKDRRILTRLHNATGTIAQQQDLTNAKLVRTESLVVLGNISLKGVLFSEIDGSFGARRLADIKSTTLRHADEGFSRLINGKANVSVNPVLRELIDGYNVYLSAEGLTKGIYVAEKNRDYFVIKSINSNSNIAFSWMLSGISKRYEELNLNSEYGKQKGIEITAEINFENGTTRVIINGLDKIIALANSSIQGNNNSAQTNNSNQNQSIGLITGNLVDEFGLETDLGRILGNATPLPNLSVDNATTAQNNTLISNETGIISNESVSTGLINASLTPSNALEFILYSTNEEFIVSQVSSVTGLSVLQAKKLINFDYLSPVNFEDEIIESAPKLDFIEKVNGSVIIRLG